MPKNTIVALQGFPANGLARASPALIAAKKKKKKPADEKNLL